MAGAGRGARRRPGPGDPSGRGPTHDLPGTSPIGHGGGWSRARSRTGGRPPGRGPWERWHAGRRPPGPGTGSPRPDRRRARRQPATRRPATGHRAPDGGAGTAAAVAPRGCRGSWPAAPRPGPPSPACRRPARPAPPRPGARVPRRPGRRTTCGPIPHSGPAGYRARARCSLPSPGATRPPGGVDPGRRSLLTPADGAGHDRTNRGAGGGRAGDRAPQAGAAAAAVAG